MAKKPTPAPESKEPPMNDALIRQDFQAANALAVVQAEQNERVTALALQLNYNGSTDPAVLENSAKDAIRRIGAGIFELGGYLLMLREGCERGHFLPALERLGLSTSAAYRYMSVAQRFSKLPTLGSLEKAGVVKLVEMLPLDDEQIEELTELGQTGELALDDVATMSVKQLRAAVRKERTVRQRQEEVNKELNAEVVQLKLDKKVVAHTDWPEALAPVTDQVAAAGRKLATALSELEACRIAIFAAGEPLSDADRTSFEAALAHVAGVYQEALSRAERAIERERVTFDKTLGDFAEGA